MQAVRRVISRPAVLRAANLGSQRFLQTSAALNIKVGDKLPAVDLYDGNPGTKVNTSTFTGKTVIFCVPGAFTPTCSKDHAPGFIKHVDALKSKGVSKVVCVSVNDPFVMAAWAENLKSDGKVHFLADTCGEFTKAIDLELDATGLLGNVRCKRCSMVVEGGKVKALSVEPDGTGLTCSSAADVLKMV
ncbi:peroxiredoxin-5, mitochondrial [Plakobranchus ocellatus]|uniref:Peroxiredoxin-5 n=1 Tax=Plakobranchus ocellatus TaxID=259542 RepID=A0AAV4CTZ3_9GAST|nr:peroxiredoxin-5, mitochondrial [Plakobranchus ocellatus]